jgi:excisionase family DNA binding protein
MVDRFYSAEEAAELLGLQVRTVRGYLRDGRLRGVRIGKQYRISAADLEHFTGGATLQQGLSSARQGAQEPSSRDSVARSPTITDSGIFTLSISTSVTPARLAVIQRTVDAALGDRDHRDQSLGAGSVSYVHDPERAHLRLMVFGTPAYTIRVLRLLQGLTEERRNLEPRVGRSAWD